MVVPIPQGNQQDDHLHSLLDDLLDDLLRSHHGIQLDDQLTNRQGSPHLNPYYDRPGVLRRSPLRIPHRSRYLGNRDVQ